MEYVKDSGKTSEDPAQFNQEALDMMIKWGGCIGAISCEECGCIMKTVGMEEEIYVD